MQRFIISREDSGQTLIKYLSRILKDAPNGLLFKQIRKKNITLNGKKAEGHEKLAVGDTVAVFMSDETISKFKGCTSVDDSEYRLAYKKIGKVQIIYEDDNIIAANKPVGLLSQKSDNSDLSINEYLIGYLLENGKITSESLSKFKPSVCNRLDRNTGGLIFFGKTLFGTSYLNKALKDRTVHKYYRTVVKGEIKEPEYIKGFLVKDEKSNKVTIFNSSDGLENPDYIETGYKPLRYNRKLNLTELEVDLVTGKSHQIRAHLASISHPIIGDHKYGDTNLNRFAHECFKLDCQLLFAVRASFSKSDEYPELSNREISLDTSIIFDRYFEG